ncbi:D-alanyl-D-alanine dipeptidase [Salmonella enterica subsp. enterica serovar Leatherhead]|nr:D-alanyl-D-alanine dipeptidase [Salmonella enterica subsp. enterica serovar Leatherhead]
MRKSDNYTPRKTPLWDVLESDLINNPLRFLLLLLCSFAIGWLLFQLVAIIVLGILLLGVLLFNPTAIIQAIATTEKLNHVSIVLWSTLKLCTWHYGVIAGFVFMLGCTVNKGIRQVHRLTRRYGS